MTITDLSDVAEQVEREVREAMRMPSLDAVRSILNEAGIRRARRSLAEAPDRLAEAQAAYREAQAREAVAKEAHGQALLEAEWAVPLHKDGNKTYRWVTCECSVGTPENPGEPIPNCAICAGAGQYRKFMLADDVKAWTASEAAKVPTVVEAGAHLRRCEMDTAGARDAVLVAEKRLSACRADLEASVAELNALAVGLAAKGA